MLFDMTNCIMIILYLGNDSDYCDRQWSITKERLVSENTKTQLVASVHY